MQDGALIASVSPAPGVTPSRLGGGYNAGEATASDAFQHLVGGQTSDGTFLRSSLWPMANGTLQYVDYGFDDGTVKQGDISVINADASRFLSYTNERDQQTLEPFLNPWVHTRDERSIRRGEMPHANQYVPVSMLNSDGTLFRGAGAASIPEAQLDFFNGTDGVPYVYTGGDHVVPVMEWLNTAHGASEVVRPMWISDARTNGMGDLAITFVEGTDTKLYTVDIGVDARQVLPGDVNFDYRIDQTDKDALIQLVTDGKYRTGVPVDGFTEGDFDGGPSIFWNPADGDGYFDIADIMALTETGRAFRGSYYERGPSPDGFNDVTVTYNDVTGELSFSAPDGLTSLLLTSESGAFLDTVTGLDGPFEVAEADTLFWGDWPRWAFDDTFGLALEPGLSEDFLMNDIQFLATGDCVGYVESFHLSIVPEPNSMMLVGLGVLGLCALRRPRERTRRDTLSTDRPKSQCLPYASCSRTNRPSLAV